MRSKMSIMRLIFCSSATLLSLILLFPCNGYSKNDRIRSLKDFTPPGRIKVIEKNTYKENIKNSKKVFMRHSTFMLDKKFVPTFKKSKGHILLQLSRPLDESMKAELSSYGVDLQKYIPSNTWKVKIPEKSVREVKALNFVYAMGNIYLVDKFPKHILEQDVNPYSYNGDGSITLMVKFYEDIPFVRVNEILSELSGTTDQGDFIPFHRVLLTIPQDRLQDLAEYDEVSWIEDKPTPKEINNLDAANLSNVDTLWNAPYGLTGNGIFIGEWDGGPVQDTHPDLNGRVIVVDGATNPSNHATHVAGTMISSGNGDNQAHGMAPLADLVSYDFRGAYLAEMATAVTTFGIQLSNNSWGYITGWRGLTWWGDQNFGNYTTESQAWDNTVIDTNLIIVKSAGNDRNDNGDQAQNGHAHAGVAGTFLDWHPPDGDFDCVGQIGSAKNIITVGALTDAGDMSTFSSWGPTDDGRIKPDIVANGAFLWSTIPTNTYGFSSGTSMSSPVATGSIAIMLEQFGTTFGVDPTPDIIKALIINTATDLGNAGPDYSNGWGLLDAQAAVDLIRAGSNYFRNDTIANNQTIAYTVNVSSANSELRVTVVWTDPASAPGAAQALVNDIDLEFINPSGGIHRPWVLDVNNPGVAATTGINTVDNVEQVLVNSPQIGNWTVRVSGTNVQLTQDFALASNLSFVSSPDTDGDGLLDIYETNTGIYVGPTDTGTDPLNPDTDGDNMNDGDEVNAGRNPLINEPALITIINNLLLD